MEVAKLSGSETLNTVVVIDDDIATSKALRRIGEREGFAVAVFQNSQDFYSWFEESSKSELAHGQAICIVLEAKALVADINWYVNDQIRWIPKICIGIPEEVKSIIEMVTLLEGQFIQRPFTLEEIQRSVTMAFLRYGSLRGDMQETAQIAKLFSTLSKRENEVFILVAQGRTNQEISDLLGISIKTVKAHRAKVMNKTQSETIADLVRNYEKRESILANQKKMLPYIAGNI
jgi:FixJ family two-component response regulator